MYTTRRSTYRTETMTDKTKTGKTAEQSVKASVRWVRRGLCWERFVDMWILSIRQIVSQTHITADFFFEISKTNISNLLILCRPNAIEMKASLFYRWSTMFSLAYEPCQYCHPPIFGNTQVEKKRQNIRRATRRFAMAVNFLYL